MPETGSLSPISDEQAKAIREALKALQGVAGFLREVLGTVPEDLVGVLGGDWLKIRRAENAARMIEKARARLEARNAKPERPSISVALPLLIAAADEDRDELQDIWARLLAAAMDKERAKSFRTAFIEIVKKMDPLDAAVLNGAATIGNINSVIDAKIRDRLSSDLSASRDQIDVALANLVELGLMTTLTPGSSSYGSNLASTPFGREFLRAVAD